MEKIKERSMSTFILSSFINLGIGLAFGLLVGIVLTIMTKGNAAAQTMLVIPLMIGVVVALLTQNMYRLYFYYRLSLDINEFCKGDGKESESYVVAMVLNSLTLGLYGIYWAYKLGQRIYVNAPRYGFKIVETGKDIAILDSLSFGFIAANELIKNTNKIAKVYNQTGVAEVIGGVQ